MRSTRFLLSIALFLFALPVFAMPGGKGRPAVRKNPVKKAGGGIGARDVRAHQQKRRPASMKRRADLQEETAKKIKTSFTDKDFEINEKEETALKQAIKDLDENTTYHLCFIWTRGGDIGGKSRPALIGGKTARNTNVGFKRRMDLFLRVVQPTDTSVHILVDDPTLSENPYLNTWLEPYKATFFVHKTEDAHPNILAATPKSLRKKVEKLLLHAKEGNPSMYADMVAWMLHAWVPHDKESINQFTFNDIDTFAHRGAAALLCHTLWWNPTQETSFFWRRMDGYNENRTFLWGYHAGHADVLTFRVADKEGEEMRAELIERVWESVQEHALEQTRRLWPNLAEPKTLQAIKSMAIKGTGPGFYLKVFNEGKSDFRLHFNTVCTLSWLS